MIHMTVDIVTIIVLPEVNLVNVINILMFKPKLNNVNWQPSCNCNNVNFGYDYFDSKVKECHNNTFKLA